MFKKPTEKEIPEIQKEVRETDSVEVAGGDRNWSTGLLINQSPQLQGKEMGLFFILFSYLQKHSV